MIGKIFANRYRIEERIGGGGMSLVYRAYDQQLDRAVAVKVLRGQFGSDEDFVRRFRREAQNAASLSHPNVVQIFDVGREDEQYFIVMELVEGQTLKEMITAQGPLPIAEATRIAVEILAALSHAHNNRIVHRDIKPHNILIARDGRVKVTDFGIARATTTDTVTHTGSIMGSAHYFSPEQANGQPTDEKSDIYSTGIVLYEMVTGSVPFQGDSPISVALKHIRDRVMPPSQRNSEVPSELDEIILRALEKDQEDRFPSADVMREVLEQFAIDHAAGRTHMSSGDFPTMDLRGMKGRRTRRQLDGDDEEEEDEEAERRAGRRAWIWVGVIALIIVALAGGGVWAFVKYLSVPDVTVPPVVGLTGPQATDLLAKSKLVPKLADQEFDDAPAGTVIKSNPPEGYRLKQGRDVVLTLSKGPNLKQIPDVRNMSLDEARLHLEGEGFAAAPDVTQRIHESTAGTVIEMSPPQGTQAQAGTEVHLTVSAGPRRVPPVVGLTVAEATKRLTEAGLVVGNRDYAPETTKARDTVLSTTPAPGTAVAANSRVDLVLAAGPSTVGTAFSEELNVPGELTLWYDVKIELIDVVNGVPNTTVIFSEKRMGGTKITVNGQFFGQAQLRILVNNEEKSRIPVPREKGGA
ncbi:MAG TPA: Stk1 family PASTA domain-containing Ser/Thr kinase [Symbiobacteriaceae bacterium]|nr:Stk1 family PASTA domain-containing Ser/Thr kinase [Symbiobacteriaceae bacterium]